MKTLRSVNPLNRSRCRSAVAVAVNSSLLTLICAATLAAHADCFAAQSGAATVTLNGRDLSGDGFGASLAFTGDLNSDGLPELLIGAPGSQRAYLAIGPFADVSDPAVSAARLNHELASPDGTTTDFGFDVAGLYDFDGDTSPDLRVAAHVTAANGASATKTFIFNGVTGGLIGTCERAPGRPTIERAIADTDRDAKVAVTDLATVFENLGATEVDGATSGDVTGDGVVDGADVGLVGSSLGNELYGDVIATDAGCPAASVSIQAIDETVCVHAENTTVLAAVLVEGVGNPVDPADIIHPENNACGDRIRECLTDPRVVAAAQLVDARCWPASGGGPTGIIGRIYCAPCASLELGWVQEGFAQPKCGWFVTTSVNITICDGVVDDCGTLAHELVHVSQACQLGLFTDPCEVVAIRWRDRRGAICRELEAYRTAGQCDDDPATPLLDCCARACASAELFWQRSIDACKRCCEHLRQSACCHEGTLRPNCVQDVDGPCPDGESHGY